MKRLLSLLLITLVMLVTGCAKVKNPIMVGKPLSFEGVDIQSSGSANYSPPEHLEDVRKNYSLDQYIVFQGVKEGRSTPIETYDKFEDIYFPDYCETNLRVKKVYYGDVQPDDIITCREWIKVFETDGKTVIYTMDGIPPIAENEEYLFILSKSGKKTSKGTDLYGTNSLHYSYHKLSDFEAYKAKVRDGTTGTLANFGYEVLDYYLNQPETKLDLRKEALKYVENIPEDATEEEILQALPEDKKDLFDRMIKQYGTVTAEKNENTQKVAS